jgi:hypothetical protein
VHKVAFARGETLIASTSVDQTLRLWDLAVPRRLRELEPRAQAARAVLRTNPDDAAALAALGEWFALRGLPDWAADVYERARAGGHPVPPLELGRCYWRLGRRADAAREFETALERLDAPPDYLRLCIASLRMTDEQRRDPPSPLTSRAEDPAHADYVRPAGRTVDLLDRTAAAVTAKASDDNARAGGWKLESDRLVASAGTARPLVMPYRPPGEYDFIVEFSPNAGAGFRQMMPNPRGGERDGGWFAWSMAIDRKHCGFELVEGLDVSTNRASYSVGLQAVNRRYTSVVQVRGDGLRAYLDGKLVCRWRTDFNDLTAPPIPRADGTLLALGVSGGGCTVHRIEVVEVGDTDAGPRGVKSAKELHANPVLKPDADAEAATAD